MYWGWALQDVGRPTPVTFLDLTRAPFLSRYSLPVAVPRPALHAPSKHRPGKDLVHQLQPDVSVCHLTKVLSVVVLPL